MTDATGQQATANNGSYALQQSYDGNGLRVHKNENYASTYYLRSSVLGGAVIAEISGSGSWQRGYVYAGSDLLAVQQGGVNWVHEDPVTKSKRLTDGNGSTVSTVELDPWGADTGRSSNAGFQPQQFGRYMRDANGGQEAMARRYATSASRFAQPDPYGGSYSLTNPQSLNRYSYVHNDPVNFTDPSGLNLQNSYEPPSMDLRGNALGFMSPGIHTIGGWWQTGDRIDGVQTWYPAHYYTYSYVIGGVFGRGGQVGDVGGNEGGTGTESVMPQNRTIRQKICRFIPSGRTVGASGALGLLGGPTGGGEVVINYNSGQVSAFAFGGATFGLNGVASAQASTGFV